MRLCTRAAQSFLNGAPHRASLRLVRALLYSLLYPRRKCHAQGHHCRTQHASRCPRGDKPHGTLRGKFSPHYLWMWRCRLWIVPYLGALSPAPLIDDGRGREGISGTKWNPTERAPCLPVPPIGRYHAHSRSLMAQRLHCVS